jgi:putative FmdB family regulatory protein
LWSGLLLMPTYDFKCISCNKTTEIIAGFNDAVAEPICCGMKMNRQYAAPGIIFKGNGWASKS